MNNESQSSPTPTNPWSSSVETIIDQLMVDSQSGLTSDEVSTRLNQYGKNVLREAEKDHWFSILVNQFKNLIIALLFAAAVVAFAFGEYVEGWAIFAVILINSGIGFVTELKAVRSMEALREMGGMTARVRRDGESQVVSAEELVPGDIVELDGGDIVAADVRLIETSKLQVDESPLTGESVPVEKDPAELDDDTSLADRTNMVFKGTHVTRGSALGVVVGTGMDTELGEITELVDTAEEERTPLEERLDVLGRKLIWISLLIAAFVTGSGILAGKPIFLMVETGIALSVAAIPEGLPIVATIALARGMWNMAEKNALINKLSAVETLGSTTMILTDKTGTLTENEMTVRQYQLDEDDVRVEPDGDVCFLLNGDQSLDVDEHAGLRRALDIGVLCNNASLSGDGNGVGDPMEIALLRVAKRVGISRDDLLDRYPEVDEDAFDSDTKMMATTHETDGGELVMVKGAPESVIQNCSSVWTADGQREFDSDRKEEWLEDNKRLAGEGLRLLGLAYRETDGSVSDPYEQLTFLGLVALLDPPRADVREAIGTCRAAGIKVTMVTGDQGETARNIGYEVGLTDEPDSRVISGQELEKMDFTNDDDRERITGTRIFSRVSPAQKLDLVDLNQEEGHIVGMTGDGVNDAPALKKADIGIAMGKRGTQVAREAADMVLKDDAFSSIVSAVEQGRVIFKNIRKFVFYLLTCNVSEILVVGLASGLRMPLPILPLQILFLNLVTDVFPALALGMGEGDPHTMEHPPRDPDEPVLQWNHWVSMFVYGVIFTGAVLGALTVAQTQLGYSGEAGGKAVSVSFLTLALAQLWHVFNMRDFGSSVFNNDIVKNPYVWGAVVLCVGLLGVAVYVPFLSSVLKVPDPGLKGWGVAVSFSLIPLVCGQVIKMFRIQLNH